jgi:hypothetical protein
MEEWVMSVCKIYNRISRRCMNVFPPKRDLLDGTAGS